MASCDNHPFEQARGACRMCRLAFCGTCVVFPFGEDQDPLCVRCALRMSGVRTRGRGARR